MRDLKSGNDKLESFEIGPMDVKMLDDNVAVVQGSATEKRTTRGQDWSGKTVWTDIFVRRGDKWVIARLPRQPGEVRELESADEALTGRPRV